MKFLKFLKPFLVFYSISLLVLSASRFFLFITHYDRVVQVSDYGKVFLNGLRFDTIMSCYMMFLPFVVYFVLESFSKKIANKIVSTYFVICLLLLVFFELSTPSFIYQYDTRPNRLFLDYLIYPQEVFGTLLKNYLTEIVITCVVMTISIIILFKNKNRIFYSEQKLYALQKIVLFILGGSLLFIGARSSLVSKRPINLSNSIFSTDQMVNNLGVNSTYSLLFAAYSLKNEKKGTEIYGKMDEKEAFDRVKKYMDITEFESEDIPFLHSIKPDSLQSTKYNVVIFLQESLGAEYVGALGGLPLTPEFDKLTKDGLLFTNLYCTGTRSVRGIEAVTTGFLPSPLESVVKLGKSQNNFFTLASALKQHNYNTSFIYGGMANFDNMGSFFNGNGFDNIIDETVFDKDKNQYALKGTWGYSDEDLATKANEYFKSQANKPFFSLMFSTSNHEPFEFPDGRIDLYNKKQKNSVENAMKYADFSIGKFFELAKKEPYFKNTIFIVIADHNTRTYGNQLVPVKKFRIPALIIAPNIKANTKYDVLASQIDIPSTILKLTGVNTKSPMVGRNLLDKNSNKPGRAIMQFHDNNGFRVGDDMVVLQPQKEPLQFKIKNDTVLVPTQVNKELAKDALAHIITAGKLYNNSLYRIK